MQRSEPLVIFGIYSGTYKSEDTGCQTVEGHAVTQHVVQHFNEMTKGFLTVMKSCSVISPSR